MTAIKPLIGLITASALLGCTPAPVTVYDKPGVSATRLSQDYSGCLFSARQAAPPLVQTQTSYGTAFGIGVGSGSCYGYYCRGGSGASFSVDTRRVDVNETRRLNLMMQCMSDRGYAITQLPGCPREVTSATRIGEGYRQPQITQQSCAANLQGLGPVILTP